MESRLFQEIEALERNDHWWFAGRHAIIERLLNRFIARPAATALDIGCGTGTILKTLTHFADNVSGLDTSDAALALAHDKNPQASLVKGDFPQINLPDHYDVITALDVLEHIENDITAVRKIESLLAPGGIAIITVPAFMFLWTEHDELLHHKRRYTRQSLSTLLQSASQLHVEKLSYFNALLFPAIVVFRILRRSFSLRKGASDFFIQSHFLNRLFKKIFLFEGRLLARMNFPVGVSLICVVRRPT